VSFPIPQIVQIRWVVVFRVFLSLESDYRFCRQVVYATPKEIGKPSLVMRMVAANTKPSKIAFVVCGLNAIPIDDVVCMLAGRGAIPAWLAFPAISEALHGSLSFLALPGRLGFDAGALHSSTSRR